MKKIGIHDHESNNYPNVALMKLSAWHKEQGDHVSWYTPLDSFDVVYSSKVFTWTKKHKYLPKGSIIGGTGYDISVSLSYDIEHMCPDYSLYGCDASYGFLTRGCIRKCPWCFVPKKEGTIRAHADIDEFARHKHIILMDNNVLAHDHGINQIDKIIKLGLHVDFNQGLDARLIDDSIAKRLAKVKWINKIRLACDSGSMVEPIKKAVTLLRWHNPNLRIFAYLLVNDVEEALERIRFLRSMCILPFAQPFRDPQGTPATREQKALARWVNRKQIYFSSTWEEYKSSGLKKDEKEHDNKLFDIGDL